VRAVAHCRGGLRHEVVIGDHSVVVDEPEQLGGRDEGPSPTDLVAVALASCTAVTLNMYAQARGLDLEGLVVEVDGTIDARRTKPKFAVTVALPATVPPEAVEKLERIASRCPVATALAQGAGISHAVTLAGRH
jgi:putative redox protein